MGARTLKTFDAALTGSLAVVYTVPAGTKARILACSICNDTGGVITATVQLKRATAGTLRTVVDDVAVADEETMPCWQFVGQGLEAGGEIQASGNGLDLYGTVVEIVE